MPDPGAGRHRPDLPRSEFWTERTVRWYRRAVERGDYAGRVLEAIGAELDECRTALDVGAGCGALAIPLARRLRHVTALEPSPAMARGARQWAADAGLANVTVVQAAWGEVPIEPHDLVLCAHVANVLRPESTFVRDSGRLARRLVALVRDSRSASGGDKFFFRELYPALLGRAYGSGGEREDIVPRIRALGVTPRVIEISYRSDQPFADLAEACDFWMTYLGLSDRRSREYLDGFLRERGAAREGRGGVDRSVPQDGDGDHVAATGVAHPAARLDRARGCAPS
jgi:hypothetical protein